MTSCCKYFFIRCVYCAGSQLLGKHGNCNKKSSKCDVKWHNKIINIIKGQNNRKKLIKISGIQIILSYLRAQPRRQSEREMSPTRNPFPVQAKKREIPGIKKKKVNQRY